MPSAMIHLLVAANTAEEKNGLFWLGNLAPDCVSERLEKDRLHLRREPDRAAALQRLAASMERDNPFDRGCLLHLYTDLCWDSRVIPAFRASFAAGEDWFSAYRRESHQAGYELYHRLPWSRAAFRSLLEAELCRLGTLPLEPAALDAFRQMIWRKQESSTGEPSVGFPPAFVEEFARRTAAEATELAVL